MDQVIDAYKPELGEAIRLIERGDPRSPSEILLQKKLDKVEREKHRLQECLKEWENTLEKERARHKKDRLDAGKREEVLQGENTVLTQQLEESVVLQRVKKQ